MSEIITRQPPELLLLTEGAEAYKPEQLADQINGIKAMARRDTTTYAIAIGQRLLAARNQVAGGQWMAWLRDNVDYSVRTAENLMGLAQRFQGDRLKLVEGLDVTKAVMLLGVSDDEIATLVEQGPLEDASTRELQQRIRELREQCEKQQLTIEELMKQAMPEPDPIERNQVTMLQDAETRHRAEMDKAAAELDDARKKRDAATKDAARNAEERRAAERERDQAQQEADRLRAEMDKASAAMAEMEQRLTAAEQAAAAPTETIPEETRQELERLRAQGGMASFKASYATVQQGWAAMLKAAMDMEGDSRDKVRRSMLTVLDAMRGQVEGL